MTTRSENKEAASDTIRWSKTAFFIFYFLGDNHTSRTFLPSIPRNGYWLPTGSARVVSTHDALLPSLRRNALSTSRASFGKRRLAVPRERTRGS